MLWRQPWKRAEHHSQELALSFKALAPAADARLPPSTPPLPPSHPRPRPAAAQQKGESPRAAAAALAAFARQRAADPAHLSPFAYSAQQLGYRFFGGKMDDITVVCAYVSSAAAAAARQQPPSKL